MRITLRLALVAFVISVASSLEARSQLFSPFYVSQGYDVALAKARDTLGVDAYLVYAGTFGNLDLAQFGFPIPVTLNFYQDSVERSGFTPEKYPGQADAWGYVFNSPSKGRTMSLVALNAPLLGGWQVQGVPVELPLPAVLVDTLELNMPGTRSDTAMFRLKRNSTYAGYHAQYPGKQPNFVTLGSSLPDEIVPPDGFEITGPIWSFTFQRGGDTSGMVCLVAAISGETVCRVIAPAAAPEELDGPAAVTLRALPNPAGDQLRIVVDNATALRGEVTLELLDARGAHVRDLSASLLANDLRSAELDASSLPTGIYFCRLVVDGAWTVVPVTIGAR